MSKNPKNGESPQQLRRPHPQKLSDVAHGLDDFPSFLRRCRERLDPIAYGFASKVRRTPGLRREEIAQRAHASVTWYTWLEQGRGGVPSSDMIDRLSRALDLSADERAYLFMLAQQRPPAIENSATDLSIARLQAVLDSLNGAAAFIKNHRWDVLAWNVGASAVLSDYGALVPERRNVLDILFCTPEPRERVQNWEADARRAIAALRRDVTRVGAQEETKPLIESLSQRSDHFQRFWDEGSVSALANGRKLVVLPGIGNLTLDYNAFEVEGAAHLAMIVYTPASERDHAIFESAVNAHRTGW